MERQLVTLQKVVSVEKHPNADSLDIVQVLGWKAIAKLGEFKPGDEVVWHEPDAFIPATDERYKFLAKTEREWRGTKGYRLKTMKLRGTVSAGLALPIKDFYKEVDAHKAGLGSMQDLLHIQKWEEDPGSVSLMGNVKGTFPSFIKKTDQERIQNLPEIFADLDAPYEVTLKHDGTSLTVYFLNGVVGVCSRNQELKLDDPVNADNLYIRMARSTGLINALERVGLNMAVQAEIVGPGIQKCRGGETEVGIRVFDVFDIQTGTYMRPGPRALFLMLLADHGFIGGHAEILHPKVFLGDVAKSMSELLAWADTLRINGHQAEGAVFKPILGGQSFKVISNNYLMEHNL